MSLLPSKIIAETITVSFDFTPQVIFGELLTLPVVTVLVLDGVDPNPELLLTGNAILTSTTVTQQIFRGLEGVVYGLICTLDGEDGNTYTIQHTLAVLPNDGVFGPPVGLSIVGIIPATACFNEFFSYSLHIINGYPPYGPVTVSAGAMPLSWVANVVGNYIVINGNTTDAEAVYNFTLHLVDFVGNVALSPQEVTVENCVPPVVFGNIWVGNDDASFPAYHLVDHTTNVVIGTGPASTLFNFVNISYDLSKLYAGTINNATCGYVDIASQVVTSFASGPGKILIDTAEQYGYCHFVGSSDDTLRKVDLSSGLELAASASTNVGDMCWSKDRTKIHLCRYTSGDLYYWCDIATFTFHDIPVTNMQAARGIAISPDELYVYIACTNNVPQSRLLKLVAFTGVVVIAKDINDLGVGYHIAARPDGTQIAVSSLTGTPIWIFDTSDLSLLYTLTVSSGLKTGLYNRDGSLLYITTTFGALLVYETANYTLTHNVAIEGAPYTLSIVQDSP